MQCAEGVAVHLFLDIRWRCKAHLGLTRKQIWINKNPLSYIISAFGAGNSHGQSHGHLLSPVKAMHSPMCYSDSLVMEQRLQLAPPERKQIFFYRRWRDTSANIQQPKCFSRKVMFSLKFQLCFWIVKVLGAPCFCGCFIFSDSEEIPQKKTQIVNELIPLTTALCVYTA